MRKSRDSVVFRKSSGAMLAGFEKLTQQEIYERCDIRGNVDELSSGDPSAVRNALRVLGHIFEQTGRRDAFYVMVGFFSHHASDLGMLEAFAESVDSFHSPDLIRLLLSVITKRKEVARRALTVQSLDRLLRNLSGRYSGEFVAECEALINGSVWGAKMKDRLIEALYGGHRFSRSEFADWCSPDGDGN